AAEAGDGGDHPYRARGADSLSGLQGSRRQGRAENVPRGQGRTPGRRLAGAAGPEGDRPVHRAVLGARQGLQGTARAPYRGRGVGDVSASPRTLRRGPAQGDGRADDAIKESPEEGAQRSQGESEEHTSE